MSRKDDKILYGLPCLSVEDWNRVVKGKETVTAIDIEKEHVEVSWRYRNEGQVSAQHESDANLARSLPPKKPPRCQVNKFK